MKNLDPNDLNEYFTNIGVNLQSQTPCEVNEDYRIYLGQATESCLNNFDEITSTDIIEYIKGILKVYQLTSP